MTGEFPLNCIIKIRTGGIGLKKLLVVTFIGLALSYYLLNYRHDLCFFQFDKLAHIIGGMFAGSFGMYSWLHFNCLFLGFTDKKIVKVFLIFCALSSSAIVGLLWELYECYFCSLYPLWDTICDLIADVLGGWLVSFFYIKTKH